MIVISDNMLDFKGEVEKYKKIHRLTNEDIAKATGYAKTTIDKFMCESNSSKTTINIAVAISVAFSIPLEVTQM